MRQKTIWMPFLLTGISLFTSCNKGEIDSAVKADFLFINKTDSDISFDAVDDHGVKSIELVSGDSSELLSVNPDGGYDNPDPETCCQEILADLYTERITGGFTKNIRVNDTVCVIHLNEKSVLIENYSYRVISDRHFKYTYFFTGKDIENPMPCE